MAWQLIFSSVPRGLHAGKSGYCTAARHPDLRDRLVAELERLSAYHHVNAPFSGGYINPIIHAHRTIRIANDTYHVFSRMEDAGMDYSRRSNYVAHHLIATPEELLKLPDLLPTDILCNWDGWRSQWNEPPRFLDDADLVDLSRLQMPSDRPLPAESWKRITGDAGTACLPVVSTSPIAFILSKSPNPGNQLLPLFRESLGLVAPDQKWQITFTTFLQDTDRSSDFRWAAAWTDLVPPSIERRASIDLTNPTHLRAPDSPLAQRAREGDKPPTPQIAPLNSRTSSGTGSAPIATPKSALRLATRDEPPARAASARRPDTRPPTYSNRESIERPSIKQESVRVIPIPHLLMYTVVAIVIIIFSYNLIRQPTESQAEVTLQPKGESPNVVSVGPVAAPDPVGSSKPLELKGNKALETSGTPKAPTEGAKSQKSQDETVASRDQSQSAPKLLESNDDSSNVRVWKLEDIQGDIPDGIIKIHSNDSFDKELFSSGMLSLKWMPTRGSTQRASIDLEHIITDNSLRRGLQDFPHKKSAPSGQQEIIEEFRKALAERTASYKALVSSWENAEKLVASHLAAVLGESYEKHPNKNLIDAELFSYYWNQYVNAKKNPPSSPIREWIVTAFKIKDTPAPLDFTTPKKWHSVKIKPDTSENESAFYNLIESFKNAKDQQELVDLIESLNKGVLANHAEWRQEILNFESYLKKFRMSKSDHYQFKRAFDKNRITWSNQLNEAEELYNLYKRYAEHEGYSQIKQDDPIKLKGILRTGASTSPTEFEIKVLP